MSIGIFGFRKTSQVTMRPGELRPKPRAPQLVEEKPPVIGIDVIEILGHRRKELKTAERKRDDIATEQRRVKLAYEFESARLAEALRQTETVIASQNAAIDVLSDDLALQPNGYDPNTSGEFIGDEFTAGAMPELDGLELQLTDDEPGAKLARALDEMEAEDETERVEKLIGAS